jgi:xanthine dehydrogenase accessory factor
MQSDLHNQSGSDEALVKNLLEWLAQGLSVYLCTVARTWGSSPRPKGSLMIVNNKGQHFGSVSGGCVEEELIQGICNKKFSGPYPESVSYGVDRESAQNRGLPCGGQLDILVEKITIAEPFRHILDEIQKGHSVERRVCLNTGEASLHKSRQGQPRFSLDDNNSSLVLGPVWNLILIGSNHLSYVLAQMAVLFDYKITVCDPRQESVDSYQEKFNHLGVNVVTSMPDDYLRTLPAAKYTAVMTLTHDPKIDDMALLQALEEEYFYVGALGSRKTSKERRIRLGSMGIASNKLSNLHAPIGLDLGSHTPAEIAVAILAHLVAVRNSNVTNIAEKSNAQRSRTVVGGGEERTFRG